MVLHVEDDRARQILAKMMSDSSFIELCPDAKSERVVKLFRFSLPEGKTFSSLDHSERVEFLRSCYDKLLPYFDCIDRAVEELE